MPWGIEDVERHNKGLTVKQKRMWVHVANGALDSGDDDGTAITKANGVVKKNRIQEQIESMLRAKAETMIEVVVMQQIAEIFVDLQEADPLPRVEKDINNKPVVPTKDQYHQYFSDMHHEHIKTHLKNARERWAQAAKEHEAAKSHDGSKEAKERAAEAAAHLKAVKAELSTGQSVLRSKTRTLKKKNSLAVKKLKQKNKGTQGLVKAGATALFGKSRMATSIAKHVAGHILKNKLDKLPKT